MTHQREPLTTEQAFDKIVGDLKIERAAAAIGKADRQHYLRAISNPASEQRLAFDDAVALDIAYAAEVEPGHYPLFESYRLRLALAEQTAIRDAVELGQHAARCARENGEACAAVIEASIPGASLATLRRAIGELEQARSENAAAIGALQEVIRRRGEAHPPTPP